MNPNARTVFNRAWRRNHKWCMANIVNYRKLVGIQKTKSNVRDSIQYMALVKERNALWKLGKIDDWGLKLAKPAN